MACAWLGYLAGKQLDRMMFIKLYMCSTSMLRYCYIPIVYICMRVYVSASVITTTQIHPTQGKTLSKALEKAMKQRDLDVVSCNVYTIHIVNNNDMRFVTYFYMLLHVACTYV